MVAHKHIHTHNANHTLAPALNLLSDCRTHAHDNCRECEYEYVRVCVAFGAQILIELMVEVLHKVDLIVGCASCV